MTCLLCLNPKETKTQETATCTFGERLCAALSTGCANEQLKIVELLSQNAWPKDFYWAQIRSLHAMARNRCLQPSAGENR